MGAEPRRPPGVCHHRGARGHIVIGSHGPTRSGAGPGEGWLSTPLCLLRRARALLASSLLKPAWVVVWQGQVWHRAVCKRGTGPWHPGSAARRTGCSSPGSRGVASGVAGPSSGTSGAPLATPEPSCPAHGRPRALAGLRPISSPRKPVQPPPLRGASRLGAAWAGQGPAPGGGEAGGGQGVSAVFSGGAG